MDNGTALEGQQRLCLLYTSDAADERSSVDLGGRRIIKKKKYTDYRVRQPTHEPRHPHNKEETNTTKGIENEKKYRK